MVSVSPIERTALAVFIAGTALLGYVAWDMRSQTKALQHALADTSRRSIVIEDAMLEPCRDSIRDSIAYAVSEVPTEDAQRLIGLAQPLPHVMFVQQMREALYDVAGLPFDGAYPMRRLNIDECGAAYDAMSSPQQRSAYVRHLNNLLEKK